MTYTAFAIAAESFLAAFLIWGIFHEDKLKAFERRLFARIRARRRARRLRRATDTLCRDGYIVVYRDAPRPIRDRSCVRVVDRWYYENSEFGKRNAEFLPEAYRAIGGGDKK